MAKSKTAEGSPQEKLLEHFTNEINKPDQNYVSIDPVKNSLTLAVQTSEATLEAMNKRGQRMYQARTRKVKQLLKQAQLCLKNL